MRAKMLTVGLVAMMICVATGARADDAAARLADDQKAQVARLLAQLKTQAAEAAKPADHEVAVPVATAGARGAEVNSGNRFAVIWPDKDISPLTALVRNLDAELQTKSLAELAPELDKFVATYPEYALDPQVRELQAIFKKAVEAEAAAVTEAATEPAAK